MMHEEMVHLPGSSHPSGNGGNGTKETVKKERTNWKKEAQRLQEELAELKEEHLHVLQDLHKLTKSRNMPEREAKKLRRLEHIAARIINAPLCDNCKRWVDQLYDSEIKYTRETNGPQQAVGG